MNPNILDIQLLQVFDVLMEERNVTRAARRIGLSQSALSHALSRLRERLDDPLFIRGSGGVEPTARALELLGPVRDAIRQVEAVFRHRPSFDPLQSTESFVIRIGDSNDFLLLPPLLRALEANAPQVSIVIRHLSPADTVKALEDGSLHLAVSALLRHPKSIRSTALIRDRMVCAMSREHPMARKPLTVERFLTLRHIRVVQEWGDSRFVDEALRAGNLSRRVVATIPHWLVALHAVSTSGLVVAASERMARRFDFENRLALRKLPLGGEPFAWSLYWHQRHDASPSQRWLRALVADAFATLDQSMPSSTSAPY